MTTVNPDNTVFNNLGSLNQQHGFILNCHSCSVKLNVARIDFSTVRHAHIDRRAIRKDQLHIAAVILRNHLIRFGIPTISFHRGYILGCIQFWSYKRCMLLFLGNKTPPRRNLRTADTRILGFKSRSKLLRCIKLNL
ncbi:hypothetical protein D3C73_1017330 [compost metagenome]